jgi:hypothetical protein
MLFFDWRYAFTEFMGRGLFAMPWGEVRGYGKAR